MRIHFIGICGASMSGLAGISAALGHEISGSDVNASHSKELLNWARSVGARIYDKHCAENVYGADLVVYSLAIKEDNAELCAARQFGARIKSRAQFLAHLERGYGRSVAISGTHGKTSTTAMLYEIMKEREPSVHIGGNYESLKGNWRLGRSDIFITEACEYRRSFCALAPFIAVILNCEMDHPDYFKDEFDILEAFREFAGKAHSDGLLIVEATNTRLLERIQGLKTPIVTFGLDEKADFSAKNLVQSEGAFGFDLCYKQQEICKTQLKVLGEYNVLNALAAAAAAHKLGADSGEIQRGLSAFRGVKRRFEYLGKLNGAEVVCDYAHHPTELNNALKAARFRCKGRLFAIFQPHTYSRTSAFFDRFVSSMRLADAPFIYKTFAARESGEGDLIAIKLAQKIGCSYLNDFGELISTLKQQIQASDTILLLGAGDLFELSNLLD